MADLVADITYLQEQFQHEADLNSWVCLAMPAWGNVGVPTIGELFHPTAPPPEPPGKILDGSGRPVPPSKASLLEKAEYAKATRSIRFSDEHGRDRDASIEEVAKAIQLREYLNSHNGMVDQYGPPPWVMTPRDLRRARVTEHVTALTWEAERLLVCVLDGPNQISADFQEQIQNEIKECPLLGWMRWLRSSVSPSGPVWRIENYPKVAVTGLMQLRGVVGAKAQGTKTGENASVDSGLSPDDGSGRKPAVKKTKKSTQKGDAERKIISVLTTHHKYAKDEGALNSEPISVRQLARVAQVAASSVSRFFDRYFLPNGDDGSGYDVYAAACRRDFKGCVLPVLKSLNGDYTIEDTFGKVPPGEQERDQN